MKRIILTGCGTAWHAGIVGEFLFEFVFFFDLEEVERDAEALGGGCQRVVVAHDERDVHGQFAGLVAREQVVEAVGIPGDENSDARDDIGEMELPIHGEPVRERLE